MRVAERDIEREKTRIRLCLGDWGINQEAEDNFIG